MSAEIPAEALQLRSLVRADQTLELFLDMVPVPEPGPDEVVIRVEAAPLNPSDMGLLLRMENHSALVHTAAASNLGQMLSRLCIEQQIPLVNIVRKPGQEAMLRAAGAVHVCDSASAGFLA